MRVVLGVGGGIAAYKAAELTRILIQNGAEVQCVMTAAATEFVQPLTFATLTGRKVITSLFSTSTPEGTLSSAVEHIRVAKDHDLLLIAPATANVVAKFAHGIADDFLSTMYLAFAGPVVLAPAMNDVMWSHTATQHNMKMLRERGHRIVEPGQGFLACGTIGPGRMAEPADIASVALELVARSNDLAGETVLVTAGPTREPIDPVRYISNRSSGRMGYALAQEAQARGAKVILISGPVQIEPPSAVHLIPVATAEEMRSAVLEHLHEASIIIKCAAVADYRVAEPAAQKIKKSGGPMTLALEAAPDILAEVGRLKGDRVLIGFAAETEDLEAEAMRKLEAKHCDMIVANHVGGAGTAFDSEQNEVTLVRHGVAPLKLERASKRSIAGKILDQIPALRGARTAR